MKDRAARIAVALAAVVLSLAAVESGLRAWSRLLRRQSEVRPGSLRILCLGESTTAPTYGLDVSWPHQLQILLDRTYGAGKVAVINEGRMSTNSSAILGRLPGLLELYRPKIIVAMMGANDGEWFAQPPAGGLGGFLAGLRLVRLMRGILHQPWEELRDAAWEDPRWTKAKGEAAFFLREGRSDRAWRSLEPLLRAGPDADRANDASELFLQFGDRSISSRLARLGPIAGDPLAAYWNQVDRLESERRFSEEDGLARRALSRFPDDLSARLLMLASLRRRDPARALDRLQAIARAAPPRWPLRDRLLAYLFDVHRSLGRPEDARRDAEALVQSFPQYAYTWRICMDLEAETGHLREAQRLISSMSGVPNMKVERVPQGEAARRNLLRLRDLARERSASVVVMQYPLRDPEPLRWLFAPTDAVLVVSNRETFREALMRHPYEALFRDRYVGDFGHCTAEGNTLIARNLFGAMAKAGLLPAP